MTDRIPGYRAHKERHAACPKDAEGNDLLHPPCDEVDCFALLDPQTIEEMRVALDHWEDHCLYSGCSHGC